MPSLPNGPASWLPSGVIRLADRLTPAALRLRGYRQVWVPTNAGKVHCLEVDGRGDLPPFLLLHGLGSCASDYAPLVELLRPYTRRLILPDLPGHGLSESPRAGMDPAHIRIAVREALDARIGEPCFVFGNSLGGLAAVRFAQIRPERVMGLLLASPGGAPMSPEELSALMAAFDISSRDAAFRFVDRFLGTPHAMRPVLAAGVRSRMNRPTIRDLMRRISTEDLLTEEEVRSLPMPVWCFWGMSDDVLPVGSREFFRRVLPATARFEAPEGYGHAPYLDHPKAFLERVTSFARDVVAATQTPGAAAG